MVKNGGCIKCDCNGNIDSFADGNCNSEDGTCYNCTKNTEGSNCELCKDGYFGNAKNQTCKGMRFMYI